MATELKNRMRELMRLAEYETEISHEAKNCKVLLSEGGRINT